MSIITRKTGTKRYSYSICTDEILPNGRHKYIYGPYFTTKKEAKEAEATAMAQLQADEAMTAEEKEKALG